jgi:hypothetical protein
MTTYLSRKALHTDRKLDLRKFELNDREWEIAKQLRDTLKVRLLLSMSHTCR